MRIGIVLTSLALATGGLATSAQAATIVGSVALGAGGVIAAGGPDLNGATAFTFTAGGTANRANVNLTSGDYTAILAGSPNSTTGTLTIAVGSTYTMTIDGGSFTGTVGSFSRDGTGGSETLSVALIGLVTGVPGFMSTPSSLSIAFTQSTPTSVIGVGFSLQSPPSFVPEPASLAMAGLGLAGIAGVALKARRKATVRA